MTTSLQLLKFPLISAESEDISSCTIQLNFGDEVFFLKINDHPLKLFMLEGEH